MTNEEKARELALRLVGEDQIEAYQCLVAYFIEMAQWKDDKFYTLLACVKFSLEKSGVNGVDEFINNIKKEWEK